MRRKGARWSGMKIGHAERRDEHGLISNIWPRHIAGSVVFRGLKNLNFLIYPATSL